MKKLVTTLATFALSLLCLIFLPTEVRAETFGDLTYSVSNKKVTITDCSTYTSGVLVIPSTINGYPVTSIGASAFYGCTGLTSVTIPDGITSIGNRAFQDCTGLTSITIPSSVTRIGFESFEDCYKLTDVYITDIAMWCGITFGSELINVYSNPLCYADNLYLNGTPVTDLVIPSGVTRIGIYAFSGYSGLKSVTIPEGVTAIGDGAFYNCNNLSSVTISDSVTSIGAEAFYSCDSLTDITIGNGVTSIGSSAFSVCNSLTYNVYSDGKYLGNATNPYYALMDTVSEDITSININDATVLISTSAFSGCTDLTSVTIPGSVTRIGNYAFQGCTSLTGITIPNSVIRIGNAAFSGCNSLESITIPFVGGSKKSASATYQYPFGYIFGESSYTGGVATTQYYYGSSTSSTTYSTYYIPATLKSVTVTGGSLNYGAFENCGNLTGVTIGNGVTRIGDYAFSSCTGLTGITIPDSVTRIGNGAFYNCTGLTGATIGNRVTSIGYYAFRGCSNLTGITIPDSITSIGKEAFYDTGYYDNATNWEKDVLYIGNHLIKAKAGITGEYIIKDNTRTISDLAFWDCIELTGITFPDSVTAIGDEAFYNCDSLTGITIPDGVTTIGDRAFSGCNINNITIPDSVTAIGEGAFKNCSSLASVHITDIAAWCNIDFYDSYANPLYGYLYEGWYRSTYLYLNGNRITDLVIPDNVTSIGDYAFYDYRKLTSIILPKSVTAIGKNAFYGCTESVHIWYGGSQDDRKNIVGEKPSATWHYNYCGADNHNYDYACDDTCNSCGYPRDASHVYDDAEDVTCNVCKQTLAPAAPIVQSVTDTTVTLYAVDGYEYSIDAMIWQTGNVFTGLQPTTAYNFYQRVAAGADNLASPASKALSVKTDKYVADISWDITFVEITDTSVRLKQVADCEYSIDGRNWQSSPVFTDLTPGTRYTFYQRTVENSEHYASANTVLYVTTYSKLGTITYNANGGQNTPGATTGIISTQTPTRSGYKFMGWALTPYAYALYQPGDRYSHQEDILLYADWEKHCNNCSGDGEYILKCSRCSGTGIGSTASCVPCGGKGYIYNEEICTYAECVSGKIIISSTQIIDCPICKGDGICDVPVDCSNCYGTGSVFYSCSTCNGQGGWTSTCSQCVSGIQKFTPEAPQMPELLSVSCNTVVLVYYSTCEYSNDGVNWQDSNVFSNLNTNTQYVFYQRYKGTTYSNSSTASPVLSVTTLKESVLPPQPPVLQSKTFNKVILEKVDGCEYSLDGINWHTSNVFDDLLPSTSYTFYCRFAETATHLYSAASEGLAVVTQQSPLYNVVFADWDGTEISSNTYRWGDEITVPANPAKAADNTYTYTFAGWDKNVVDCVGDAVYTATYTPTYIDYTVVFKDEDGTILSEKTYHYGDLVEVPADPEKAPADHGTYCFTGWDKEITAVTEDVTYTAQFVFVQVLPDFTGDGEVTDADAIYLLRYTLFPDIYPILADGDVNNDGDVNDADAIYLLRHTLFPDYYPLYSKINGCSLVP